MANSRHLKRHSMPTSWQIKRKNIAFISKPNPGSHKLEYCSSIIVVLRDILGLAKTAKEVKYIVNNTDVLINGKKITDIKAPCGMFDIIEIKKTGEKYIVVFDTLGKIKLVPTKDDQLYLKISNKKMLPGKKYQLNFMNGFNLVVDEKTFNSIKAEDTIIYDIDKKKVSGVVALKEGSFVYIFDGKYKGNLGKITKFDIYNGLTRDVAEVDVEGEAHSTAKDYCFAIGTKKEDLNRFK